MNDIIDKYKQLVMQIATPFGTGTGFMLKNNDIIITNEHVARGAKQVVVTSNNMEKQVANVVYLDPLADIAFLRLLSLPAGIPTAELCDTDQYKEGEDVIAIGNPFGLENTVTRGIISKIISEEENVEFIQHDAALNPGNSGGPLINDRGKIIGMNTSNISNGENVGFALSAKILRKAIEDFHHKGEIESVRCHSCFNIVTETKDSYCPFCGTKVHLPSDVKAYEAVGIPQTIESIIEHSGNNVFLARQGANNWQIKQGSAYINVSYHEKTGFITGDAYLCTLPSENIQKIYEYLLRQNLMTDDLTFSVRGHNIILSLLIYDNYFNEESGLKSFKHLFDRADYYDNILVEQYGAKWRKEYAPVD